MKISFTDYSSGIRLPDCSRLTVNWKNGNDVTILWHDFIVNFFWRCFASFVKFNYYSNIHLHIITGSWLMTISLYKRLTRNPEIGNSPVWVLPNIWRLGPVRNTKFGRNLSNKMLLNAAKCQCYSFYRFCVIKGKPIGRRGSKIALPLPRLELKRYLRALGRSFVSLS